MQLETCIQEATKEAVKNNVEMIICRDPISNAEEDGDYGYCPAAGRTKELLYKHGTITHRISTTGEVTEEPT